MKSGKRHFRRRHEHHHGREHKQQRRIIGGHDIDRPHGDGEQYNRRRPHHHRLDADRRWHNQKYRGQQGGQPERNV